MANFFSKVGSKIKKSFSRGDEELFEESDKDFVELETAGASGEVKVMVRPYVLSDFADIKEILDALREGNTIAMINIKPLKEKDMIELKRAINKLKKTCDALEGDVAGFGDDYIVATPKFAQIFRTKSTPDIAAEAGDSEE
ncbi:MAG: cell division protein SepF [Candidatus Woesearchaeota archaeon]|nr:cell division protein SepF [Candidatus Woesearchaeota archaeon]